MSNKLVYKKIFIDSKYRTPQSRSSSDFSVELNENLETPEGTRLYITEFLFQRCGNQQRWASMNIFMLWFLMVIHWLKTLDII